MEAENRYNSRTDKSGKKTPLRKTGDSFSKTRLRALFDARPFRQRRVRGELNLPGPALLFSGHVRGKNRYRGCRPTPGTARITLVTEAPGIQTTCRRFRPSVVTFLQTGVATNTYSRPCIQELEVSITNPGFRGISKRYRLKYRLAAQRNARSTNKPRPVMSTADNMVRVARAFQD